MADAQCVEPSMPPANNDNLFSPWKGSPADAAWEFESCSRYWEKVWEEKVSAEEQHHALEEPLNPDLLERAGGVTPDDDASSEALTPTVLEVSTATEEDAKDNDHVDDTFIDDIHEGDTPTDHDGHPASVEPSGELGNELPTTRSSGLESSVACFEKICKPAVTYMLHLCIMRAVFIHVSSMHCS